MCFLDVLICSCGLRVAPGAGAACSPCIWRTLVEVCSVSIRYGYLLWPVNVMRVGPRMLFRHTVLFMRVACHPRCWNLPLARLLGFVPFLVRCGFSLRPVIVVRVVFLLGAGVKVFVGVKLALHLA